VQAAGAHLCYAGALVWELSHLCLDNLYTSLLTPY